MENPGGKLHKRRLCSKGLGIWDIAMAGMMVSIIEVSKMALMGLPNVELTSFWLIMFTLFFGWKIVVVVPAFILIEGTLYGIHLWWIMYLYAWPILVGITWIFRKKDSPLFWAILSGAFGLSFGFLCSFPYLFLETASGGLAAGLKYQLAWWVAGIPWDVVHCIGNFTLMLVLYLPVRKVMKKISPLS